MLQLPPPHAEGISFINEDARSHMLLMSSLPRS